MKLDFLQNIIVLDIMEKDLIKILVEKTLFFEDWNLKKEMILLQD